MALRFVGRALPAAFICTSAPYPHALPLPRGFETQGPRMPDLPFTVWIILAGVLGLLVRSFLNVVILRLPERMAAIGTASCRERVCRSVSISVVAVSLKKKLTLK